MVWLKLLLKISGMTSSTAANRPQTTTRPVLRIEARGKLVGVAFEVMEFNDQPSLLPKRPLGLKIRINTSNKYGKIGAIWLIFNFHKA